MLFHFFFQTDSIKFTTKISLHDYCSIKLSPGCWELLNNMWIIFWVEMSKVSHEIRNLNSDFSYFLKSRILLQRKQVFLINGINKNKKKKNRNFQKYFCHQKFLVYRRIIICFCVEFLIAWILRANRMKNFHFRVSGTHTESICQCHLNHHQWITPL